MILHVTNATHQGDYRIAITFNDGHAGIVDLGACDLFHGPVFGPLHDPAVFTAFVVDPELNTLVWPNGADLAPEFLASRLLATTHPNQLS